MKNTLYHFTAVLMLLSLFTAPASGKNLEERMIPKSISPGLDHLAELICSKNSEEFDPDKIEAIGGTYG